MAEPSTPAPTAVHAPPASEQTSTTHPSTPPPPAPPTDSAPVTATSTSTVEATGNTAEIATSSDEPPKDQPAVTGAPDDKPEVDETPSQSQDAVRANTDPALLAEGQGTPTSVSTATPLPQNFSTPVRKMVPAHSTTPGGQVCR